MMRRPVKLLVSLILILFLSVGCSGGGKIADPTLNTVKDELTKIGNGSWEVTTIAKEGSVINVEIQVADDPGKVTFREGKSAEEIVLRFLPDAKGKIAWRSVQGIGLRTILLEEENLGEQDISS